MKSRSGFRIAVLALIAVGVLSLPAISQAHKKTYASAVTATAKNKNLVEGTVASGKLRCLPARNVRLYSPTGLLEATATTDAQGGFRIVEKNLAVGTHYVNVRKRVIKKTSHHRHTCGAAQSSFVIS